MSDWGQFTDIETASRGLYVSKKYQHGHKYYIPPFQKIDEINTQYDDFVRVNSGEMKRHKLPLVNFERPLLGSFVYFIHCCINFIWPKK